MPTVQKHGNSARLPSSGRVSCTSSRLGGGGCARFGHPQGLVVCVLVTSLCAYELRQYTILAMNPERPLYELVPNDLLRLVNILKT